MCIRDRACPESKLPEDWSLSELGKAYRDQFGIEATGIQDIVDKQALAEKMYNDAEAVILKKEEELGPENYLRLFRNFFLREIDKQWIEHLQAMDHLRDGIGLRGYGQRKPELEYKREGYDMFVEMVNGIKGVVARQIVTVAQASEEDLQQLEAQRRREAEKRQERMRGTHASASESAAEQARSRRGRRRMPAPRGMAAGMAQGAPNQEAPAPQETVRREEPKVGRNDPCPCGSGKKYKKCCGRAGARLAAKP